MRALVPPVERLGRRRRDLDDQPRPGLRVRVRLVGRVAAADDEIGVVAALDLDDHDLHVGARDPARRAAQARGARRRRGCRRIASCARDARRQRDELAVDQLVADVPVGLDREVLGERERDVRRAAAHSPSARTADTRGAHESAEPTSVAKLASAASRPVPMRTSPDSGASFVASKRYQRAAEPDLAEAVEVRRHEVHRVARHVARRDAERAAQRDRHVRGSRGTPPVGVSSTSHAVVDGPVLPGT